MTERQMILWFKIILCMGNSDFVGAYDIMLGEIAKRSVGFCLGYGATRCAKTLGEYALGPVSDLSIIQDYIVTSPGRGNFAKNLEISSRKCRYSGHSNI